jgi:hypothetical protein
MPMMARVTKAAGVMRQLRMMEETPRKRVTV